MRFENHPLLNAIVANRCRRVRRRDDGIIEIVEYRPPSQPAPLPVARVRWWPSIAFVMLSIPTQMLDAFVEGCALYAVSMNPGAFGFSVQDAERDEPPADPVPPQSTPIQMDAFRAGPAAAHAPKFNIMK